MKRMQEYFNKEQYNMEKDVGTYFEEIRTFRKNFLEKKDSNIVLYGIGRYTATLVPALKEEFHFTGLMDKDPANHGKILHGLPILSLQEAEEQADLIIINVSATYWRIIYRRIKDSRIPVYFLNGCLADDNTDEAVSENSYWDMTAEKIYVMTQKYDIVTEYPRNVDIGRYKYCVDRFWDIIDRITEIRPIGGGAIYKFGSV